MKKLLFLLILWICGGSAFGQRSNFTVDQIDSILRHIDSTCISGGITDYTFHKKGHKKKIIGSGADWFYTDTSGTKLLKVVQKVSLSSEKFDTYYFHEDVLIYVKSTDASYVDGKRTLNWERELYFRDGALLLQKGNSPVTFAPGQFLDIGKGFFTGNQIWRK